jgi:RNA polymerase sigma factor (sigma-70 family)
VSDDPWTRLLPRLRDDLQARSRGDFAALDDDAWRTAYALIHQYTTVLAARFRFGPAEVDEIAQELLIRLQKPETLRRVEVAGSATGYLVVMARNRLVDEARRRQREVPLEPLLRIEWPSVQEAAAPEDDVRAQRLRQALAELRAEDRALLRLRFWRGWSIREIAEKNNLSYTAAAVRLFRILRALREKLGPTE